jgi:hypothetical protein
MDAYFRFVSSNTCIRSFFVLVTAIDALFLYSALFNRDLPRRLAERFFSALSGQPVTAHRSTSDKNDTNNWFIFAFISALPPAAWTLFEIYFA